MNPVYKLEMRMLEKAQLVKAHRAMYETMTRGAPPEEQASVGTAVTDVIHEEEEEPMPWVATKDDVVVLQRVSERHVLEILQPCTSHAEQALFVDEEASEVEMVTQGMAHVGTAVRPPNAANLFAPHGMCPRRSLLTRPKGLLNGTS